MKKILGFFFVCIALVVLVGGGIGLVLNNFSPGQTLQRALNFVRAPGDGTDQLFQQFVEENIAGSTGNLAQTGSAIVPPSQTQSGVQEPSVTGTALSGDAITGSLTQSEETSSGNTEASVPGSTNELYQKRLQHFRAYINNEDPPFRQPLGQSSRVSDVSDEDTLSLQRDTMTGSDVLQESADPGNNPETIEANTSSGAQNSTATEASLSGEEQISEPQPVQPRTIQAIQG